MAHLLLGPLLRYVGETQATIWVETDAPCEVSVLGHVAPTFTVHGHHYALVIVEGLEPGTTTEYAVQLDGEPVWPLTDKPYGGSVIRTLGHVEPLRVAFGSCRVSVPDTPPYTLRPDDHPLGHEVDALAGLVNRMAEAPHIDWPDLLLLVGDQVYADILSPAVTERTTARRAAQVDAGAEPGALAPADQIADFEEYTWLYRESWQDESLRWLFSTAATAMIFDDHDVHDDWNTSAAWITSMDRLPWWRTRLIGGYATYWIYQHLGNVSPQELLDDPLARSVIRGGGDHTEAVMAFATRCAEDQAAHRWSFRRDLGRTRLLVLDSRAGRQVEEGRRAMLPEEGFAWIEEQAAEPGYDDLVLATSLPWLLAPGLHHLEAWNEAVCGGAWGERPRWRAEQIRRAVDLEHWAAFGASFHRLTELIADVGSGPDAPRSISVLSGDVHHAYLAEADFPGRPEMRSRVIQAVCSPIRNPLDRKERAVLRFLHSRTAELIGRALSRAARVARPKVGWRFLAPPTFDNQIGALIISPDEIRLAIEKTVAQEWAAPRLHPSVEWIDREPRAVHHR